MKRIFVVFRLLGLFSLLFLLLRPTFHAPQKGIPSEWAVLIDASASLKVKDPLSRWEVSQRIVQELKRVFPKSSFFSFSDDASLLSEKSFQEMMPSGKKTNLAKSVKTIFSDRSWRGAVVVTDGRQVGVGDVISAAASAGKPFVLVGLGDPEQFKDVAVQTLQCPPFAFKNIPVSIAANLAIVGYSGKPITVKLKRGDSVLSIQNVTPNGDNVEVSVGFQWTPTSLGTQWLTVEAVPLDGEMSLLNNRKRFSMEVGRDRFRVLYICGEPGPEYGFLRHQFKSDPAVELVTFVILRNSQNVLSVPENELSLIPFPTQDVLINQMATFDLVVFEEFSYVQYGLSPAVLLAIKKRVQDGGSFLLTGGPLVFGPGSAYSPPEISEMIPVSIGGNVQQRFEPLRFSPKAVAHPVLRLEANSQENEKIWKRLPPLNDVTLVPQAKPGATVLGSVSSGQQEFPVLTVWKFGKGRVGALTTRTTWRWSMQGEKSGISSDVYSQFWKNIVLWLTRSDDFKQVRIGIERKEMILGEPDSLRIWVYDEYFKPLSDANVFVRLGAQEQTPISLESHMETSGVYIAPIKNDTLGTYKAEAWATRAGQRLGSDQISFNVIEGHAEEEDLRPDFDLLKELANTTNGRFVKAAEFSPSLIEQLNEEISQKSQRKVLIWASPWFLVLIFALLGTEWVLRKKKGLP